MGGLPEKLDGIRDVPQARHIGVADGCTPLGHEADDWLSKGLQIEFARLTELRLRRLNVQTGVYLRLEADLVRKD